jgi:lipopolysaccharide transport system permease protein
MIEEQVKSLAKIVPPHQPARSEPGAALEVEHVDAAPGQRTVTVLEPPRPWQFINFRELWRSRELLYFLAWRDIKVRYKQTVLGAFWAILQPLMLMAVFMICFGRTKGMISGDMSYYPLYVYSGLLPWAFFGTSIGNASTSVIGSERLLTKIYFPRLAIPFSTVGAAAVDFLVSLSLLVVLMVYYHVTPSWSLLLLPCIMVVIGLMAAGVGTGLAALNVSYRDFRYVVPFMIQLWMFATPTIYRQADEDSSQALQMLILLNPVAGLVDAFRAAALGYPMPWPHFLLASACAVTVFFAGCLYFRRAEDRFADVI